MRSLARVPVCLINGYRLSGAAWPEAFIDRLSMRCSVISFDNRGTGRSDKPEHRIEFGNQARDVIGLLDDLGLLPICWVFRWAGRLRTAIWHADRVDRLILFATFCGGIWAEPAPLSVISRILVTEGLSAEEAARQAWPVTYSARLPGGQCSGRRAADAARTGVSHPDVRRATTDRGVAEVDSYRRLPQIRATTLVATGTHDVLVNPRNAAILAARIPSARLKSLADLGHRAIWEAPEEMAELIGDFLDRQIVEQEDSFDTIRQQGSGYMEAAVVSARGDRHRTTPRSVRRTTGRLSGLRSGWPHVRHFHPRRPHRAARRCADRGRGVQLLGSMVAYAGTYTLGDKQVIHHIDIS